MRIRLKRNFAAILVLSLLLAAILPAGTGYAGTVSLGAGSLKGVDNLPVTNAWLSIADSQNNETSVWVGADGNFTLPAGLAEGNYRAVKYWDDGQKNFVQINQSFHVNADGTTDPDPLDWSAAASNVTGKITPSVSGWLDVQSVSQVVYSVSTHVNNGSFSLNLDNTMEYRVNGFWDETTQEYTPLQTTWKIAPGASYDIALPSKNVTGTLVGDSNHPLTGWLSITKESTHTGFGTRVKNGSYAVSLEAGEYVVDGYWDETDQEYYAVGEQLTVASGSNTQKEIVIPTPNVTGTVADEEGLLVDGGYLQVRSASGDKFYGASIHKKNGTFKLVLPKNASYVVEGYWDDTTHSFVRFQQNFTLGSTGVWAIQVPKPNVTGSLHTDTKTAIGPVQLQIRGDNPGQYFWTDTAVDAQGVFSLALDNGKYVAEGYYDKVAQEFVSIQQPFDVVDGAADVEISVKGKNVFATLKKGDTKIANAWVQIRQVGTYNWFGAQTKSDGTFSLALEKGNYIVEGYYDYNAQKFVRLNQPLTAPVNNFIITVPENNVSGHILDKDDKPVANASLSFEKTGGNPEWYDTQVVDGDFSLYLPAGDYKVHGYWDMKGGKYVSLDVPPFTAPANGIVTLNWQEPDTNVTGTLTLKGTPLGNVDLQISSEDHTYWTHASVNDKGAFAVALKNGNYIVDGYWDEKLSQWVQIHQTFKVENDTGAWSVTVPTSTLSGTVYDANGSVLQGEYELSYYQMKGNESFGSTVRVTDGKFSVPANEGDYEINGIKPVNSDEWMFFNYAFSLPKDSPLSIIVPAANITGAITNIGTMTSGAQLSVQSSVTGKSYMISVSSTGNLKGYLPDGSYRIVQFWSNGHSIPLDQPLDVKGNTTVQVTLPAVNVTGSIKTADGKPMTGRTLVLWKSTGSFIYAEVRMDGTFEAALSDGSYRIVEALSNSAAQENSQLLDTKFDVLNGKLTGTASTVDITVPTTANVNLNITLPDATTAADGKLWLSTDLSANHSYSVQLKLTNGSLSAWVPDGKYKLDSFQYTTPDGDEEKINSSFNVTGGAVDSTLPASIVLKGVNVFGKLTDDKNQSVSNGSVSLIKILDDKGVKLDSPEFTYFSASDKGVYGTHLDKGTYQIQNVRVNNNIYTLDETLEITDTAIHSKELNLALKAPNVSGFVQDNKGTTLTKGHVHFMQTADSSRSIYTEQNSTGQYSLYLQPGVEYSVFYYSESGIMIDVKRKFTFSGANPVTLDITLP